MMPISCKYTKPAEQCAEAEWVVAMLCDHCEADGTMEVCDHHYHKVYINTEVRLACGNCQGTLSYISERIDHSAQAEVIN
jgi:hypothetical protein